MADGRSSNAALIPCSLGNRGSLKRVKYLMLIHPGFSFFSKGKVEVGSPARYPGTYTIAFALPTRRELHRSFHRHQHLLSKSILIFLVGSHLTLDYHSTNLPQTAEAQQSNFSVAIYFRAFRLGIAPWAPGDISKAATTHVNRSHH